jgi:putative transposase
MERKPYPTDVTDAPWALIAPLIPLPQPGGRPREVNRREGVNAIVYLTRRGCAWRRLPHDVPRLPHGP